MKRIYQLAIVGLFFLICFGLGYATLNRYDPAIKVANVNHYAKLVQKGPASVFDHQRYRILLPILAKPIYWFTNANLGSWNSVSFALLMVNASFSALTAFLILILGKETVGDYSVALAGSLIYLLNFHVTNSQLAGMVDSGEGFMMMLLTWVLFKEKWALLPILAGLGAFIKETYIPFSTVFAFVWWLSLSSKNQIKFSRLIWIVLMALLGLTSHIFIRSAIEGYIVWPWLAVSYYNKPDVSFVMSFYRIIFHKGFWYYFIWLLPLGMYRISNLYRPWVFSSIAAAVTAIALGIFNDSGGDNLARGMCNVLSPILSLSIGNLLIRYEFGMLRKKITGS